MGWKRHPLYPLEQLLTTAEKAMQRRGVTLTDAHRALYAWLLRDTQEERRRVLRESKQRPPLAA